MLRNKDFLIVVITLVLAIGIFGVVRAGFTGPASSPPTGDGLITASGTTAIIGGGSGKLTAGTIDPLYTIDGEKYATYVAGMIGLKEEATGLINTTGKTVIDFRNQEKGSNLWVFAKTTDLERTFNDLVVILTPSFNGDVWYEKNLDTLELTIHSSESGEISYRFTAPRFDWEEWPTSLGLTERLNGLIINTDSDGKMWWAGR